MDDDGFRTGCRKKAVSTSVVYRAVPENATEPSLVDDHVQDFPSSASFCLTVLGILETVAKERD